MKRLALLAAAIAWGSLVPAAEPQSASFEMALVDLQGQKRALGTLPGSVFAPRVSPDGTRVAFEMTVPGENAGDPPVTRLHVARLDSLDKPLPLQVTVITKRNVAPVWSPEGDRIAFVATGNAGDMLFWQRADGGEQPKFLVDGRAPEGLYPDGSLVFIARTGDNDYGISALDVNTKQLTRLVDLPGSEQHSSQVSRDGRWIAYASNETGRHEVWAEPLPQNGKRFQLTRQGGAHPVWAPDGSAIFFDQGGRMFRLDLLTEAGELRAGEPVQLPVTGFQQGPLRRQFDLLPDGKSFLMLFAVPGNVAVPGSR